MRIAMLGLGDIAQKAYLPVVATHQNITPILCTRNLEVLSTLAKKYKIQESYTDINELLSHSPDAVMIHSSTESHFAIAQQCLEAGVAIFIDKPLSYHYAECEQLINLAEQKNLPIIAGFNRRHAPLYQAPLACSPVHVRYQKNRHNLPTDSRFFVFDDFIHVLDFVRHSSRHMPTDMDVFAHKQGQKLASVQVQWQYNSALFTASMNRINGTNEERLEYFSENQKWQIDNLAEGFHYHNNQVEKLRFSDWDSTLYKRGFVGMIDAMLKQLQQGGSNSQEHQAILHSHQLCETVVEKLMSTN